MESAWSNVQTKVEAGRMPVISCLDSSPLKLRFAHLSFQEYFALEHLRATPEAIANTLPLTWTLIQDGWWHNLLTMGCEADGHRFADAVMGRTNLEEKSLSQDGY